MFIFLIIILKECKYNVLQLNIKGTGREL